MNLAEDGDHVASLFEECCLTRVHCKVLAALHRVFLYADGGEEMLQHALCIVEIDHRIIRIPCDGIAPPCEESCHLALFLDEFRDRQCPREENRRNVK